MHVVPSCSIYDASNLAPNTSRGTHTTRLQGDIQREAGEIDRLQFLTELTQGDYLGVSSRIIAKVSFVVAGSIYFVVLDNDASHLARAGCLVPKPCLLYGETHEALIALEVGSQFEL